MGEEEKAVVRELIAAAEDLMDVMYSSGMEASWQPQRERWHAACRAASQLY